VHSPSILICYDGSASSRDAIEAASLLLGPRRAVVLDVGPPLTPAESVAVVAPVSPTAAFEDLNLDDARTRADAGAELARRAGFEAEARAGIAAPIWEGIVDVANEIDAAAIVMGTRGLTGARELFEGSVSHQVAEHAKRPVLIVPPAKGPVEGGGPVLICYDGSADARHAIPVAAALLATRGAVVLDIGPIGLVAEAYAAAGSEAVELERSVFKKTDEEAEAGAALARAVGFAAEARGTLDSPTWRAVAEIADEVGAAAIVLGSRGLTGLRELVEGSLSHKVAQHGRRPVLVVPPGTA
jgi:nucleotide-binding universal stress UspA family protein